MKLYCYLGLVVLFLLASCNGINNSENYSFSGKVQKGPFINGTTVTLYELNSDLGQTGKTYAATITADDGSFEMNNVKLGSNVASLSANGYYFSEIYGELSGGPLTLNVLADLSGKDAVNINVLSHVAKGRIEALVGGGMSFQEANNHAKSELLSYLGVTESFEDDFDLLDISLNEDYNAVLLAFSVMLQKYTQMMSEKAGVTAELTQLLADLSVDFADDGLINDRDLTEKILSNIARLNLIDIRNYVESKYESLGETVNIPDFEKYLAKFQEKHSDNLYTSFTYPEEASPQPVLAPDAKVPNLLVPSDTIFDPGTYSVAAIIPLNSSLKVNIIGSNIVTSYVNGWEVIYNQPNGFTLNSQRQNELMSMLLYLESSGVATIEYYENTKDIPTFSKTIKWETTGNEGPD